MDFITGIILFLIGFAAGALIIWFMRQKELDSARAGEDGLKDNIGNMSREALDQNIETSIGVTVCKSINIAHSGW